MTISFFNSGDKFSNFEKFFIYGDSGSGKTPLAATMPGVFVIAGENGLKSVARNKLPGAFAPDYDSAMEILRWCHGSSEARKFSCFFYDGISATSEGILFKEKRTYKNDARKYSPETFQKTMELVNGFLAITTHHVALASKAIKTFDPITQATNWEPYAAVPKLGPAMPYHFDNVLFISRFADKATGQDYSALRCTADTTICSVARNRSAMLAPWEPANLQQLINKSNGVS
jgi:hypothetical protein